VNPKLLVGGLAAVALGVGVRVLAPAPPARVAFLSVKGTARWSRTAHLLR
jgi:hypothetical protein